MNSYHKALAGSVRGQQTDSIIVDGYLAFLCGDLAGAERLFGPALALYASLHWRALRSLDYFIDRLPVNTTANEP
jgi:hypothetical protein